MDIKDIRITDVFWKNEFELVRTEVIPYQWDALNDNVEGAAPSFCMRNFKLAARMNSERQSLGNAYVAPQYTFRGFEALPEDPKNPDPDKFYGFVFQDTDFSKWIEAVAYSLAQYPDAELERTADEAIDIVCKAQQDDGYLDTYYIINGRDKEFTNLRDHHELYCFGHLTEGAVAYYQATGKDKLLKAACRFADYIDKLFGKEEGKCHGYPGHEIAEMALARLYEATGDKRYLKLAKYFIDERGKRPYYFDSEEHPEVIVKGHEDEERYTYHQAHKPVREQEEAVGHAVRAVYLYSGMADVARLTDDKSLYEACRKIWRNIVDAKMYITGGIGATHIGEAFSFNYDLPNDTNYAETCASIGMAFFARRMLELEANSEYADILEREAYNGILSGMALDGKSFFYVNPLEVNPEACKRDERKFHIRPVRQKWFGCACCPPNLARFISSISKYAFGTRDNTLFVHLYVGANIRHAEADVRIASEFPWQGKVRINVNAHSDFVLALRIPGWTYGKYTLNGFDGDVCEENGYLYLSGDWGNSGTIELEFPMDIRLITSDYRVRANIGKVAVMRGPVVYCMEAVDNGNDLHMCLVDCKASKASVSEAFDMDKTRAIRLSLPGKRISNGETSDLYTDFAEQSLENTTLKFIPYFMWANRGETEMQVWTRVFDGDAN